MALPMGGQVQPCHAMWFPRNGPTPPFAQAIACASMPTKLVVTSSSACVLVSTAHASTVPTSIPTVVVSPAVAVAS